MPSFSSVAFVATAILALGAQAQQTYAIDPESVTLTTRENWCNSQKAACPLLCLQLAKGSTDTKTNTCDAATLDYECICGNGKAPDAASYSQTIPYFECTEYGNQCVAACGPHDSTCQTACRVDNPCGAQDPNSKISSTSSGSSSPSTTGSSKSTGTSDSGSASATATSGGAKATGTADSSSSDSPSSTTGSASTATPSTTENGAQSALDVARSYSFALVFTGLAATFALAM